MLSEAGPEGEVLEECPAEQAFGFKVGSGDVLPAFEKALKKKVAYLILYSQWKHMERQRLMTTIFQSKCLRLTESLTSVQPGGNSNDRRQGNEVYGIVLDVGADSVRWILITRLQT